MAIAKTVENNLLLNGWQRVMLEEIWAFNQVSGNGAPLNRGCQVYTQIEREPIARALDQSISRISQFLNFWPRPQWFTQTIPLGSGVSFLNQVQQTEWLKLIEFGQRGSTLIQANVAVLYSDPFAQGVDDTATITVNTSLSADEIQVFFRVADGAPGAGDARYQIEPLKVTVSGGVATITGHRALFVKPSTIWDFPYKLTDPNRREPNAADTMNAADFVNQVDVYRVYNDTTTQVQITDNQNNVLNTVSGVTVLNETGHFQLPNVCLSWPVTCNGYPTRLKVYYRAGQALVYGDMEPTLQEAIVRYSNVLMPQKYVTLCDRTEDRWIQDRAPAVEQLGTAYVSTVPGDYHNPLGSNQKAAVFAWDVVSQFMVKRGGKLGRKWG